MTTPWWVKTAAGLAAAVVGLLVGQPTEKELFLSEVARLDAMRGALLADSLAERMRCVVAEEPTRSACLATLDVTDAALLSATRQIVQAREAAKGRLRAGEAAGK